jgi:hypothetical protein
MAAPELSLVFPVFDEPDDVGPLLELRAAPEPRGSERVSSAQTGT